jgi:hypothetical protein
VLDLAETIELIGRPRHWRDALRECLNAMGAAANGQLNLFTAKPPEKASENLA